MRTRAAAVSGSGLGRPLAGWRSGLGRLLPMAVGVAVAADTWCDGEEHAPRAMTRTNNAVLGRRIRCLPGGSPGTARIRHSGDAHGATCPDEHARGAIPRQESGPPNVPLVPR